ncbi:Golgin subfamily A member 7/ERF4 [Mucor mucedo]|nr:Golgin subfamily A member 7/ERF4 [Mucor mucedo]KAI7891484.1 Golgin subfamily A member 7/ERF4 [Mucor mucedo]
MTAKAHETNITIKQRVPVKSIRIERDYSKADGITRFSTEYPAELEGKISVQEFAHTINEINKYMDYADRISWRIVLENIMEILTIYISPIFISTHYQRAVRQLLLFIESENSNIYYPQSLSISDPVKAAFLFIEINYYD